MTLHNPDREIPVYEVVATDNWETVDRFVSAAKTAVDEKREEWVGDKFFRNMHITVWEWKNGNRSMLEQHRNW